VIWLQEAEQVGGDQTVSEELANFGGGEREREREKERTRGSLAWGR
jgi:hypothetical protein